MISVVIPSYNLGRYLQETVDSVLASTYKDIEIILVDDGSTDDSAVIAANIAASHSNISFIQQANGGPSKARNTGIKQAKGEYILALDSDDLISPDYLQEAFSVLDQSKNVKVVYAEAEKFGAVNKPWKLKPYSPLNLAKDNMIYVSAVFRKSDWERVNGFTENKVLVREDWEFWIKILKDGGDVVKLPFVGFFYRIHATSRRKSMTKVAKNAEIDYLNLHHSEYFKRQLGGPLRYNRSLSRIINFFTSK
jgi:glycosyltransferase involved in cell wall biosynthesis